MAVCEYCGCEFDEEEAEEIFEEETCKVYSQLTKTLCAECAIDAIEGLVDGIYYECCERCGAQFDPVIANSKFVAAHSDCEDLDIDMFGELLCADCAEEAFEEFCEEDRRAREEMGMD